MLAVENLAETTDGISKGDILSGFTREYRCDVEGLRKEFLYLTGAINEFTVFFGKLLDAEDGDDVLKVFVPLKDATSLIRDAVVFFTNDIRLECGRAGFKRVDRRIDTERRELTRKDNGRIEERERCRRRRISEVVGGDVDGLDRCDRA